MISYHLCVFLSVLSSSSITTKMYEFFTYLFGAACPTCFVLLDMIAPTKDMCTHTHTHTNTHTHIYIYIYIYICVCVFIHTQIYTHIHIYLYMYANIQ